MLGNPNTNVGIVDLYDVGTDCREPVLLSSTPVVDGMLAGDSAAWLV